MTQEEITKRVDDEVRYLTADHNDQTVVVCVTCLRILLRSLYAEIQRKTDDAVAIIKCLEHK